MRAAVYLRISKDKTGEQAGVDRQQEDCQALADTLGWTVVDIYRDNDLSADTGKPRPEYRRMLADIQAAKLDGIICWHPDRLYRRPLDLEELIDIVETNRVTIRTCRAGDLDLTTPTGRMIARILGATAKHEVEHKADRWQRSYRQHRDQGAWYGGGPRRFGYTTTDPDTGTVGGQVIEEEAAIIREAAADLLAGKTLYHICGKLEQTGVTTVFGNPWRPETLRETLRRPYLAGLTVLDGQIHGEGTWTPILDRPTWETMRAILVRNGRPPGGGPPALLSGLAFCGWPDCGQRLYRSKVRGRPRYACKTVRRVDRHVTIFAAPLEEMVEAYAQQRLLDERVRASLAKRLTPGVPAVLVREIEDFEAQLAELRDALTATRHDATKTDLVRAMDRCRDEIEDRRARIGMTTSDVPIPPAADQWPTDLDRRARLVRLVVARVVVFPATQFGRFDPDRVHIQPA